MSEWLTLKEASDLLGVHPSTLRRWSDEGKINTIRTRGGHRRFHRRDIEALLQKDMTTRTEIPSIAGRVHSQHPEWGQALGKEARAQARELGQRLLGLLMQYILHSGDEMRLLQQSRDVGREYGRLIAAAGFSLLETVEAFLYFRRQVTDMALKLPTFPHPEDNQALRELHERLDRFMNEVLLGTIEGFESVSTKG
ncbi:MAG: helix-turn-helix domain-containing protein [Ardenticatenia bacterium]|nr:MAG: helix-turn-helix domain-containing protein [Ardenticatenia bacterium]